jgi:hypothetical protein
VESSFSDYLGINFKLNKEAGTFTMTQQGLTKKVLEAANMLDCAVTKTPAKLEALGIDPEGEPMKESWSYPSIVGMLLYLTTNTRIDCAFAVSQVARFNHNPKQSHAQGVKHILRYLKGTMDQGITVKLGGKLAIEVYCDADFAGLYKCEPDSTPTASKSRMGYVIFLAGFPLIWKSKLISETCLSTAEAEYSALSYCLRDLIPVRRLILEMATAMGCTETIHTTIHEDNDAARLLATNHQLSARTKYYLVKLHHFWEWMTANADTVSIVRVASKQQKADYLTKSLPAEGHGGNRMLAQGF